MYIGLMKIGFDPGAITVQDQRELRALGERLRARFKVAVTTHAPLDAQQTAEVVIATVRHRESEVSVALDQIAAFCEQSGFGRVDTQEVFQDHVDGLLGDFASERDSE